MGTVIYKFTENNQPKEEVCGNVAEAIRRAVSDVGKSHIYPREIVTVVLDRKAITRAWEEQYA